MDEHEEKAARMAEIRCQFVALWGLLDDRLEDGPAKDDLKAALRAAFSYARASVLEIDTTLERE